MKISLALDNCFAMKRWTAPREWMEIAQSMGIQFIEASADNEIDPLYSTPEFLGKWREAVAAASAQTGVRVANLYSGHGTYSTLGLAHDDPTVRRHIKQDWMKPMLRQAAALKAGLGFYVHAFSERVLNDPALYENACHTLIEDLRELAREAGELPMGPFGIEQMYSPHQIPWTIAGTWDFLRQANGQAAGAPVYITLDTGHQIGQRRYLAPSEERLRAFFDAARTGSRYPMHLGTRTHYLNFWELVRQGIGFPSLLAEVEEFVQHHPYLFSLPQDGNPYQWLENFGGYSPIIHVQQTDGRASSHKGFTAEQNANGIISAPEVLRALQRSGQRESLPEAPKVSHIYLTLEIFLSTACDSRLALDEIAESADYWRRYVPRDGMELEEAIALCGDATAPAPACLST